MEGRERIIFSQGPVIVVQNKARPPKIVRLIH